MLRLNKIKSKLKIKKKIDLRALTVNTIYFGSGANNETTPF